MNNQDENFFIYDEDGLFEIDANAEASVGDLSGGIQTANGPIAAPGEASGAFCHNKDSCK